MKAFKKLITCAALASLAVAVQPAFAAKPETPTSLAGAKVISADEGKTLVGDKSVVFVDTRNPLNFGKGHVPGAITASYKEKSEAVADFDASQDSFTMDKLPADKNAKIVFYSDGPTGWKSYKAAVLAVKAGYKNVMYMRGGFAEWQGKGHPVEN